MGTVGVGLFFWVAAIGYTGLIGAFLWGVNNYRAIKKERLTEEDLQHVLTHQLARNLTEFAGSLTELQIQLQPIR